MYDALPGRGVATVDEIAVAAALPPARVLAPLAMLEVAGLAAASGRLLADRPANVAQPAMTAATRIVDRVNAQGEEFRWQVDQCTPSKWCAANSSHRT